MSNDWKYRLKLWLVKMIEALLPDSIRRQALYTLEWRAYERITSKPGGMSK